MSTSTHWSGRAACADRLDLPWTTDAADVTAWQAATMRAICADCPALFDCLAAVDDLDVTGGWWAGTDRDPHAQTAHLDPPAWATDDPAPAPASTGLVVSWVPVRGKRGRLLAEQAAFALDGVGVA